tara:strand:- start:150 stop:872 length:723 start_codon:yes stop_codon:yes gene_type:complete
MNTEDFKNMGQAYLQVLEEAKKKKADKDAVLDDGDGMDPVGQGDADIDNDGDTDKSDEYLHKRRKAIAKTEKGKEAEKDMDEMSSKEKMKKGLYAQKEAVVMKKKPESDAVKKVRMALASKKAVAKPKSQVSLAKAPWEQKEDRTWTVYNRLIEKAGDRGEHVKGATDPEAIDSKASKGEKDFVAAHGGLTGNDSGIDGAKAAEFTMAAIKNSVKAGPANTNDNTSQKDKMEVPTDTTKA